MRDRWRQMIRLKHPASARRETEVRSCLTTPSIVRESAKDPNVHLYYATMGDVHLCVATAPGDEGERFVVTAYFTKNIKLGNELWKS